MGKLDYVQTVEDNMKLSGKQQIAGTVQARELLKKKIYPSTGECGPIVNPEGIQGCKVTPEDVQGIPGCEVTRRMSVQEKSQGARSRLRISLDRMQLSNTLSAKP